jgi:hypothetical protein
MVCINTNANVDIEMLARYWREYIFPEDINLLDFGPPEALVELKYEYNSSFSIFVQREILPGIFRTLEFLREYNSSF